MRRAATTGAPADGGHQSPPRPAAAPRFFHKEIDEIYAALARIGEKRVMRQRVSDRLTSRFCDVAEHERSRAEQRGAELSRFEHSGRQARMGVERIAKPDDRRKIGRPGGPDAGLC